MEYRKNRPVPISEFRKSPHPSPNNIEIPLPAAYRRSTDKIGLLILVAFTVITVVFSIYTLRRADIRRLRGYDNCGNLCGVDNSYDQFQCSGQDFSKKPYLILERKNPCNVTFHPNVPRIRTPDFWLHERYCIASCPDDYVILNKFCIKAPINNEPLKLEIMQFIIDDAITVRWSKLFCVIFSVGITILFMVSLTYFTALTFWLGLFCCVAIFIVLAAISWYYHFNGETPYGNIYGALAFYCTTVSLILLIIVVSMLKSIKRVVTLYKVAAKAISSMAMPWVILLGVLFSLIRVVLFLISVFLITALLSSGILTEIIKNCYYIYKYDVAVYITFPLYFIMWLLYDSFVVGCQHMIMAWAISFWYFSSSKSFSRSPILTAIVILLRFHLGTAFVAGFHWNCILTAMHGEPNQESSLRAEKLLDSHALDIKFLRNRSDFIFLFPNFFILSVCVAVDSFICVKSDVDFYMIPGLTILYISGEIVECFMFIYLSAMDTIYICFCEDTLLNNGMERPYAMSEELRQFIKDSVKPYQKRRFDLCEFRLKIPMI